MKKNFASDLQDAARVVSLTTGWKSNEAEIRDVVAALTAMPAARGPAVAASASPDADAELSATRNNMNRMFNA